MQVGDDWGFWRWVGTVLISILSGVASGAWIGGRKARDLERNDQDFKLWIDGQNKRWESQAEVCAKQKAEMLSEMQREICNIVERATSKLIIDHNKELAKIGTSVEVQSMLMGQIQKDVEAIFGRLNRRTDDHDDHGERRK